MMIIEDEYRLKVEESMMIGDNNSTIKEDEINDLSISNNKIRNNDLFKSVNRRKQVKPNRVTNDDDGIQQQELIIDESTDLTNDHQSSSSEEYNSSNNNRQQQEAFCNLCERSFCNKYFLKTHFAKKHGVLNTISPLSLTENNDNVNVSFSPSSSPCLSNEQPLPLIINQQSSSPINNKSIEKISEDYCEICQKRFCNKYYLRKHKGECHGVYTDYIKSLQKSTNESPIKTTTTTTTTPSRSSPSTQVPLNTSNMLLLNPFYPGPSDIKSLFPIPSSININIESSSSSSLSPPKSSPQRSIRRCNICEQEFRNKSLLRMHMNTFHPNEKNKKTLTSSPILPSNNLGFLQPFVDTTSQFAHKLATGQTSQTSYGIVNDSYFCAKMADRVVCEICNKQVCNKYFLKTHKAKVHGITNNDIQEQINENNTIENSDTYCLLCKKDFSTKYFYLFHMQTIHNDTSDSTYQTLIEYMKTAMNENSNTFLTLINSEQFNSKIKLEQEDDDDDESDGNIKKLKRKRSLSQSSIDNNKKIKHFNSLTETNAGLQPFLLESEDPKFSHTFVPCMVYLPVIRRVTKQVKINLRLKPVLADASS